MTEPGQKGRVSFTRLTWRDSKDDEQVALGQFDVDDQAKILEMDFKVDSHDGMIWFKYDEGRGPLAVRYAAILVVPDAEHPDSALAMDTNNDPEEQKSPSVNVNETELVEEMIAELKPPFILEKTIPKDKTHWLRVKARPYGNIFTYYSGANMDFNDEEKV